MAGASNLIHSAHPHGPLVHPPSPVSVRPRQIDFSSNQLTSRGLEPIVPSNERVGRRSRRRGEDVSCGLSGVENRWSPRKWNCPRPHDAFTMMHIHWSRWKMIGSRDSCCFDLLSCNATLFKVPAHFACDRQLPMQDVFLRAWAQYPEQTCGFHWKESFCKSLQDLAATN